MSDPDRNRQREHWQAIAEQLGLAPESETPAPGDVSAEPAPLTAEARHTAEPSTRDKEPPESPTEEAPPRRGRRGRSAPERESPPSLRQRGVQEESTAGEQVGPEREESATERPAPRRGRRRRSDRDSAAADTGATDASASAASASEEDAGTKTAERPKRRGRGRGRQKKPEAAHATNQVTTEERSDSAAPNEPRESEIDDMQSLSNWNVPSWNELIASLYRPER